MGHITRVAAYLCTSRHGIFYFRFPIPPGWHSANKRTAIKVSLGTREPSSARALARRLVVAGQAALARLALHGMRYEEMREHVRQHFAEMLGRFREQSADAGPVEGVDLDALKASETLASGTTQDWLDLSQDETDQELVRAFCTRRGVADIPEGKAAQLLASEVHKGFREYVVRTLEHTAEFDTLRLEQLPQAATEASPTTGLCCTNWLMARAPLSADGLIPQLP